LSSSVRIAVSLALAALLLGYFIDWRETVETLGRLDVFWAVVTLAIITADRALMSFKWGLLLRTQGHKLPVMRGMMVYCSAMVWGLALPSTVGADAIRIALVRRHGIASTDAAASIVVERVIGFVCALLLGVASLVIINQALPGGVTRGLVLAAALGLLFLAVSFWFVSTSERAFNLAQRLIPARWQSLRVSDILQRLHYSYRRLAGERRVLATFGGLTLFEQTFTVFYNWSLAIALGIPTSGLWMFAAVPVAILISRLPVSIDGIGVYEGVFIAVLALSGMDPAHALAIAVSGRVLQLIAWLPWWAAEVISSGSLRPPAETRPESH
jgi:uncharacterized protein (TIRG00374 family)